MDTNDEDYEPRNLAELVAKYQNQLNHPCLADIDSIDWSVLTHAHGAASDVPGLLRAALSPNEDDREFAFELLHETIWHQGTVYQASAYVIPYLFNMLDCSETPDKAAVAFLIASLADGHSYLEVHAVGDINQETIWRKLLAENGRELEAEVAKELAWVKAARDAVGKRLSLLYPYLGDKDETVRWTMARVLGFYPERTSEIIAVLQQALVSERKEYIQKEIQETMTKLLQM